MGGWRTVHPGKGISWIRLRQSLSEQVLPRGTADESIPLGARDEAPLQTNTVSSGLLSVRWSCRREENPTRNRCCGTRPGAGSSSPTSALRSGFRMVRLMGWMLRPGFHDLVVLAGHRFTEIHPYGGEPAMKGV